MRYHYTSIRMAKIKNSDNTKCWQACAELMKSHKNLCTNVYSSFIHNNFKLETTLCPSADEWLNKLWSFHTTETPSNKRNY